MAFVIKWERPVTANGVKRTETNYFVQQEPLFGSAHFTADETRARKFNTRRAAEQMRRTACLQFRVGVSIDEVR